VTVLPIDPSAALGGEWQIQGLGAADTAGTTGGIGTDATAAAGGGSFGGVLTQQIDNLTQLQTDAASAAQSLADGTATDPSSVVAAVEKAQLAMQLAGQIRTKAADAVTDIFHTQI
jgi:flagellar hook-basal body complex protein FliE